jgi:hypothetical protein
VIVDAVNATRPTPGVFRATGHDYKADLPLAALVAYGVDRPDDPTWERLLDHLRAADADRARRGRLPDPDSSGGAPEPGSIPPGDGAERRRPGLLRRLWSRRPTPPPPARAGG